MVIESFFKKLSFFYVFFTLKSYHSCMNYLYYEYKSSTVCTVKEDEKLYYKSLSTQNYLNEKCLLNGSTLKGRQEAFVYQMKVDCRKILNIHASYQVLYDTNESKKIHSCCCIHFKKGDLLSQQIEKST